MEPLVVFGLWVHVPALRLSRREFPISPYPEEWGETVLQWPWGKSPKSETAKESKDPTGLPGASSPLAIATWRNLSPKGGINPTPES